MQSCISVTCDSIAMHGKLYENDHEIIMHNWYIYVHYAVTMLCHAHIMSSDPLLTHVKVLVSIPKGEGHNIYQDRFLDPNWWTLHEWYGVMMQLHRILSHYGTSNYIHEICMGDIILKIRWKLSYSLDLSLMYWHNFENRRWLILQG